MMDMKRSLFVVLMLVMGLVHNKLVAQTPLDPATVIQFSGVIVTADDTGDLIPLPYTNVTVNGSSRGATSDLSGFFSFAALQGEVITFSRMGYQTVEYTIPDTLQRNMYSVVQIMSEDAILLPETVIFPWPSKKHFAIEFLAMDVSDVEQQAAQENMTAEKIKKISETLPYDGTESSRVLIANTASQFRYSGQFKPQNIFNPLAWKKFVDAWRSGAFSRKQKMKKVIKRQSAEERARAKNNPFKKSKN